MTVLPRPVTAVPVPLPGMLGLAAARAAAVLLLVYAIGAGLVRGFGEDAHAYWIAGQHLSYTRVPGTPDAFLYSPLFADAVRPLAWLPWPLFYGVWIAGSAAALYWLLRPVPSRWAVPIALACTFELVMGNIHLILAAVVVAGLRGSRAVWLLPVLTKVASGVGLLWFVVRGEWRQVAAVAAGLVVVVAGSVLLQPGDWLAWLQMMSGNVSGAVGGTQLLVRVVVAVGLTVVAGRTGRAWLVPVAMVVVNPISLLNGCVMLAAVPRLSSWSAPTRFRSTVSPASRPMPIRSTL